MTDRFLIVGAGLTGAVVARELSDAGARCTVVDSAGHVGGKCHTLREELAGCLRHVHGPHIFHTDLERVWKFVNRFASFNNFVNRPKVRFRDALYSFPVNLFTLYQLYGVKTPAEAAAKLAQVREDGGGRDDLESWCLSQVGREIYETFIRGYTAKQWGADPSALPSSIIKRLPVRLTFDDNYFTHPHQGIPVEGYTAMVEAMLGGIEVRLGVDFLDDPATLGAGFDRVVFTGQIDRFFGYELGTLEYRSLEFENELLEVNDFQGNAIVNYTEEEVPFTRIVEHKHFSGGNGAPFTAITREYPRGWTREREPYYPVETPRNRALFEEYAALARERFPKVTFCGRLGSYRYLDMDRAVEAALDVAKSLAGGG